MEIRNSKLTGEKGLFSTKKYKKGDIVYILSGEIFDKPTRETIHIGNNKHTINLAYTLITHLIQIFL